LEPRKRAKISGTIGCEEGREQEMLESTTRTIRGKGGWLDRVQGLGQKAKGKGNAEVFELDVRS